eukprot:663663-Rhodomonas_salina.2
MYNAAQKHGTAGEECPKMTPRPKMFMVPPTSTGPRQTRCMARAVAWRRSWWLCWARSATRCRT